MTAPGAATASRTKLLLAEVIARIQINALFSQGGRRFESATRTLSSNCLLQYATIV